MPYITQKSLRETININDVENEARQKWEHERRRRRRLEGWIIRSLPVGVVVMVVIFYTLSAPHTAGILNIITPNAGLLSPLAFELGVLIVAALREAGWKNSLTFGILYSLLLMSIVINVAGSFIAVVEHGAKEVGAVVDFANSTLPQLLAQFGSLSARFQVVLVLVIPIGFIIPVIAKLAGEIIIKLALGHFKLEQESDEERWAREVQKVMYGALMQVAMRQGAGAATASQFAEDICTRLYRQRAPQSAQANAVGRQLVGMQSAAAPVAQHRPMGFIIPGQSQQSVPSVPISPNAVHEDFVSDDFPGQKDTWDGQDNQTVPKLIKKHVVEWLLEHPEYRLMSDRDVSKIYTQEHFGIASDAGYKTIQRAKQELG